MFQKRGRCGRCQQVVDFGFVHVAEYEARDILPPLRQPGLSVRAVVYTDDGDGPDVTGYGTAPCPLCGRPSFFQFTAKQRHLHNIRESLQASSGLFDGGSLITLVEALPLPARPEIDPHWPAEIHEYFRDAQALLAEERSPAIIITTCRSVLEMSVKPWALREEICAAGSTTYAPKASSPRASPTGRMRRARRATRLCTSSGARPPKRARWSSSSVSSSTWPSPCRPQSRQGSAKQRRRED